MNRLPVLIVLLGMSIGTPLVRADSPQAAKEAGKIREQIPVQRQLDRVLPDVKFDKVNLSDTLDFLRDVSGARFFVDWKHLETAGVKQQTPISMSVKGLKFDAVLREVLKLAGGKEKASYAVAANMIVISTKDRAADLAAQLNAQDGKIDPAARAKMERMLPQVHFNAIGLADVLEFLQDVSGEKIVMDWNALATVGVHRNDPVTADLKNVPFGNVLRIILWSQSDKPVKITASGGTVSIAPAPL